MNYFKNIQTVAISVCLIMISPVSILWGGRGRRVWCEKKKMKLPAGLHRCSGSEEIWLAGSESRTLSTPHPFQRIAYRLFPRWTCKISHGYMWNIPSGVVSRVLCHPAGQTQRWFLKGIVALSVCSLRFRDLSGIVCEWHSSLKDCQQHQSCSHHAAWIMSRVAGEIVLGKRIIVS